MMLWLPMWLVVYRPSENNLIIYNKRVKSNMSSEVVLLHNMKITDLKENDVTDVTVFRKMDAEAREKARGFLTKAAYAVGNTILGGVWGGLEGMASGTLIGVSVTGAGWWFAGTMGQVAGAITGFTLGTLSGATMGLVAADRRVVAKTIKDYRRAFGVVELKFPLR
ncbi:hypothetical protein [Trichoplusia ni ascovirus 6b]|nr:hypothetical protein [Trichoplusia ni ascovirus 6b]